METGLWHQLCEDCYEPLYENHLAPEPVHNRVTSYLLKGPLIIKTDAGPGRLLRDAQNIEFCETISSMRVIILLSLPTMTT